MTQPSDAPRLSRPRFFQRHWTWWFLILVLVVVAAVRLRLLNFPLERDEGEYAYSGQLMLQGIPPYQLAYNMKFPGTYAMYAVILALFGQTPAGIHFGVLVLTTLTAVMLFWLGRQMLDWKTGMVAATFYAVLAASPSMLGLAGHATHFAAFFATAGLCALWKARPTHGVMIGVSGILFGLAILMKQHGAVLALWAAIFFTANTLRQSKISWGRRLAAIGIFGATLILPFAVCCLVLWRTGVLPKFWFWTVQYAREYASIVPLSESPRFLWQGSIHALVKGCLLLPFAAAGGLLLWFDERLARLRLFIFTFALASVLSVFPDFYFRKHYFLLMLPGLALLAGVAVSRLSRWSEQKIPGSKLQEWPVWIYALTVVATMLTCANIWFVQEAKTQVSRTIYGADPFPEAEAVAQFIRAHSPPSESLVVLGSEPELYFLSRRHSATGYIYTYGMMEPQPFARRMQDEMMHDIETSRPRFIIFVDAPMSWFRQPDSDLKIFDWWDAYQTNYTMVAIADVVSSNTTVYAWGVDMIKRYGGARGTALEVYQRNTALPIIRSEPGTTE